MAVESTTGYTLSNSSDYLNLNESLCDYTLFNNSDDESINYGCGIIGNGSASYSANLTVHGGDFESSMEMVFEVGLLTLVGILGLVGNVAAIILFAR